MKKKLVAAVTLAAVFVTGLGAALAAPGTAADPFVTLSYLTGTYYPQVEQAMEQQAQIATADTEKAAMDKLNALAGSFLAQAGGRDYTDTFASMILCRDDRLDLPAGASLLFEAGQIELTFSSGQLVDVTAGSTVSAGKKLTEGHRYVVAENSACSVTAVSDSVYVAVRGYYNLDATGSTYTPFIDITGKDWYAAPVLFAYEEGLFTGLTKTTFSPSTTMNRAMLATVLSRLAGVQGTAPSAGFTDVPANQWYANAVNWAANAGIVTGMGNGTFAPNNNVTREQMAVMLYRYAKDYMLMDVSATGDLSTFSDHAKVSPWAQEALAWAVGNGIINGMGGNILSPGGTATRAEVATMLQRFARLLPY